MNDKQGYIKLYRKALHNELFQEKPYDRWHAWEDILLSVNYERTERIYKGKVQITNPGQMQTSVVFLAERWGWSRNKVRRFLEVLEVAQMCKAESIPGTTGGTTLTVINWKEYQLWKNCGKVRPFKTPVFAKNRPFDEPFDEPFESTEIPTDSEIPRPFDGTFDETIGEPFGEPYKKNIKKYKNSGAPSYALGGAPASANGKKNPGDIIVDADGVKYIVLADGSIDRYRRGSK